MITKTKKQDTAVTWEDMYASVEEHATREVEETIYSEIAALNITDWDVLWVIAEKEGLRDGFGGSEYRNRTTEALAEGHIKFVKGRLVLTK